MARFCKAELCEIISNHRIFIAFIPLEQMDLRDSYKPISSNSSLQSSDANNSYLKFTFSTVGASYFSRQ